jgi:uncharacterized membrane protein YedE/YeeE
MKSHINTFSALGAGLVFGIGLIFAGMTDPSKVIGFLDVAGKWDPSLAFVMGGAIFVGLFAFKKAKRRDTSLLGEIMRIPTSQVITKPLIIGSVLFGAGWGLGGFCPGPGITALGTGNPKAAIFVIGMVAGMLIFEWLTRPRAEVPDAGGVAK